MGGGKSILIPLTGFSIVSNGIFGRKAKDKQAFSSLCRGTELYFFGWLLFARRGGGGGGYGYRVYGGTGRGDLEHTEGWGTCSVAGRPWSPPNKLKSGRIKKIICSVKLVAVKVAVSGNKVL